MRSRPVHRLTITLLFHVLAPPAEAQIEPGRIYTAGERVEDPSSGLALTLPQGWRGALAPDGSAFVMEADAGDGYLFVVGEPTSEAEVRSELASPIDLGDGIVLRPAGSIREISSGHLSAEFDVGGAPSELDGVVDVRLTETGLGVAFILLTPPAAADDNVMAMRELALSLGVTEPATNPSAASAEGGNDEWEPYLRGRYLARFYTGSGYTEKTELWLCTDGTFYFDDQGGGFGGGASGAFQSRGDGRWTATGAGRSGTLELQWADGSRSSWALEYDARQDHLYLNGDRWLRGANERCS